MFAGVLKIYIKLIHCEIENFNFLSFQITGFKDFFIGMNFPYSVVRGEEVSLQVDVFNYQSTGMAVSTYQINLSQKSKE